MALMATAEYYDATEIATRILPHLVVLTVDSDGYDSFVTVLSVFRRFFCSFFRHSSELVFADNKLLCAVTFGQGLSRLPINLSSV